MTDFMTSRRKKLDLVISRPDGTIPAKSETFRGMVEKYNIPLSQEEAQKLRSVPDIAIADVGAVLVALEAKAVMTAHVKALPRLYDELNSSHLCVHGASNQALAIGYVQINLASKFVSSVANSKATRETGMEVTENEQPKSTVRTIKKVSELPRRSSTDGRGFDGIGITVLNFENRGGVVDIVSALPAPQPGDPFHYAGMITRMGNEYDSRFHSI
ncbi:hypothetical protein [Rhodococcus aetherivorans]|uniref:hypothetical protein n=1 Tax=Rhodococcus aetherivorans TaxID=191292 RepID=UPI00241C119B|nr:hypothetical protein [Rhodococcus aetherivorans]WFS11942.1 hypothetical protein P9K37_19315 [Rhodococcus aetherivorans]